MALDENSLRRFQLSSFIRFTLLAVYLALVLPLPALAPSVLMPWLVLADLAGLVLIWALLSEHVDVSDSGLRVGYPTWCGWLFRRSWSLEWDEISGLVPISTSQGGRVYYFTTDDLRHQLLPQRLNDFPEFLAMVERHSGINTSEIKGLTPPWTYRLLAGLAVLMLASETTTFLAIQQGWALMPPGGPG
ncbi:hypothetical protein [Synechococcus sp. MIT S9451]|uniref:hypothetical protein n=1 Tax=Synechococcus sp. MIT S9451 TaxID=3082543 RepID=UPI0039B3802C